MNAPNYGAPFVNLLFRDGSLFMGMTGSDKKRPGHEKFGHQNEGL